MHRGTRNVLAFALGLLLVYSSYYGICDCQKIILDSFKLYTIDAFLGLSLNYGGYALGSILCPVASFYFTTKQILLTGLIMLSLLGLPLIYPYPLAVYILDFISGLGVGPIWYTLGWVIIRSSTAKTLDRNIGIIFFFYMLGPTLGNFFLFVSFSGKTVISDEVRYITVAILYVIGFLGPLTMIFFDQSALDSSPEEGDLSEETEPLVQLRKDKSVKDALMKIPLTFKMASTNSTMLLLEPMMFFSGIDMAIWSGVLGTCVGNYIFEPKAKALLGLSGVFVGAGEIAASLIRTVLPVFLKPEKIRLYTVLSSTIGFNAAFLLMHFYLPSATLQHEVSSAADVTNYYVTCLVLAGFLLGLSGCFVQSEIYACLSVWFPEADSNNFACSIFLVQQALGGSFLFGLSTFCYLDDILIIGATSDLLSTIAILVAHFKNRTKLSGLNSIQNFEQA